MPAMMDKREGDWYADIKNEGLSWVLQHKDTMHPNDLSRKELEVAVKNMSKNKKISETSRVTTVRLRW